MDRSQLNLGEYNNGKKSVADLWYPFRWKTIILTVDIWDENQVQHIKSLFLGSDDIQNLELTEPFIGKKPDLTREMSGEELTELLCQASNLKSLSVTVEVLSRISTQRFTNTQLQERLSTLESLQIIGPLNETSEEEVAIASENIRMLSRVPKMRLKRLSFYDWHNSPSNSQSIVSAVMELMERHQTTLEDLKLYGDEIWRSDGLAGKKFLNLKALSTTVVGWLPLLWPQIQEALVQFLEKQPLLERFKLHIDSDQPNLELLRAIQRRSAKLKEFSLTNSTSWVEGAEEGVEVFLEWNFLQELRFLKKVKLGQDIYDDYGERIKSMREILSLLPASLESAKISDASDYGGGKWSDENPHLHIIPCFSRLRNLTKLNFLGSWNSITDPVLQCICSTYLNQLLELKFGHCNKVTDFGITGRRGIEEDTGISLNNLKG